MSPFGSPVLLNCVPEIPVVTKAKVEVKFKVGVASSIVICGNKFDKKLLILIVFCFALKVAPSHKPKSEEQSLCVPSGHVIVKSPTKTEELELLDTVNMQSPLPTAKSLGVLAKNVPPPVEVIAVLVADTEPPPLKTVLYVTDGLPVYTV